MTAPADTIHSYTHGAAHREDFENAIYNVDPTMTPFQANIGRGTAKAISHDWQTDILRAAERNAQVTADDAPNDQRVSTVRLSSPTQIGRVVFGVSGTDESVDKAGMTSRVAYESTKAGLEWRRDVEFACTNAAGSAIGDATTARQTAAYTNWISTNVAAGDELGATGSVPGYSAGTVGAIVDGTPRALTEDIFKGAILKTWQSGGNGELCICGGRVKQLISAFDGIATRFRPVDSVGQTQIIGAADVYVSDFTDRHRIVPSQFHEDNSVGILTANLWQTAFLRGMRTERLAKTGDSERRMVIGEWCLVSRNEKGNSQVRDIS